MKPIIDAHLDLAWNALQWNRDLTQPLDLVRAAEARMTDHVARGFGTVTLPEMGRAHIAVCLGTILARTKPNATPEGGFSRRDIDYRTPAMTAAVAKAQLAYYRHLEQAGHARLIRDRSAFVECFERRSINSQNEPLGIILAMEGADPITHPSEIDRWWAWGLRCVGMAHYGSSPYATGTGAAGPITAVGCELLREMEQAGIILDLTHCAEPGFFQALDLFGGRVMASHNTCRTLVPGDRQFSDGQLLALLSQGAVIGIAMDAWMLHAEYRAGQTPRDAVSLEAAADHIEHICQLAGNAQHVGIGSDLDGGYGLEQTPHEMDSIADLQKLEAILERRGFSEEDRHAVFCGNWFRFFKDALPAD